MKKGIAILSFLVFTAIVGCEDSNDLHSIIGKWRFVKIYSMMSGHQPLDIPDQEINEYRKNKVRIVYDHTGMEIDRCNYRIEGPKLIYSGTNLNSQYWEIKSGFRFSGDTLVIRADGGFEFMDGYWIRFN